VALAAIAHDGDLLALDEVEIGVAVVIDAHEKPPFRGLGWCFGRESAPRLGIAGF
jgi:hypothetical protein